MRIVLLFMLSQYFDLMIQAVDYSKYFGSSIQDFRHLILSILHQIHIVDAPDTHLCQLWTRLFPDKLSDIQLCIRIKLLRLIPVKPGCYQFARLWLLSSSHYPGYPIKKLTSHHKGKRPIASNRLLKFTTNRGAQRL